MIDKTTAAAAAPQSTEGQGAAPRAPDADRAKKFSGTLAAWMSRSTGIKANYAGQGEEDADPEPIKAGAPIIAPDAKPGAKSGKGGGAASKAPTGTTPTGA